MRLAEQAGGDVSGNGLIKVGDVPDGLWPDLVRLAKQLRIEALNQIKNNRLVDRNCQCKLGIVTRVDKSLSPPIAKASPRYSSRTSRMLVASAPFPALKVDTAIILGHIS